MIVLLGGEKGGTGKTTLAINLAVLRILEGHDVLLLDADVQGSASFWRAIRDESDSLFRVPAVQKFGNNIHLELAGLADKYEDIIIDTGGRDSQELRSAMLAAHRLFVPLQPSQFDVWALGKMSSLIRDCKGFNPELEAFAVINRASTNPVVSEAEEAREFISELDNIGLAQTIMRDRIAFRRAARDGHAVMELKPSDEKAVAEIKALYEEVFHA